MRLPDRYANGRRPRRGVTMVEMLVVVALVVLMMVILASIFQAALGAISASRTFTELDNSLRGLDITIRADLEGCTARFTPPLRPSDNLGYFEYGENAPADLQGEDTDDYLAFTVKAPEGQPFVGRVWVPGGNFATLPATITSQFAEVIYFLRNGNLYRRVLLIAPERAGTLIPSGPLQGGGANTLTGSFQPTMFGSGLNNLTSWLSCNDISAHPATASSQSAGTGAFEPVPNTLGNLTNREYRFARSRHGNDFYDRTAQVRQRDGVPDDFNYDGVYDYWPTLTWTQVRLASTAGAGQYVGQLMNEDGASMPGGTGIISPQNIGRLSPPGLPTDLYAFPFVNSAMYSTPEKSSVGTALGWLHAVDPGATAGVGTYSTASGNIKTIANHNPLQVGDSLPQPSGPTTFFAFPTWRETASVHWTDPVWSLTDSGNPVGNIPLGQQPLGLQTLDPTSYPAAHNPNFPPPLGSMPPDAALPPQVSNYSGTTYNAPYGGDDAGSLGPYAFTTPSPGAGASIYAYSAVWDDDLIMTGVRSFDVKAYDPNAAIYNNVGSGVLYYNSGYFDLGYAATELVLNGSTKSLVSPTNGVPNEATLIADGNSNPIGFGHEGRMPPMVNDYRLDPNRPFIRNPNNRGVGGTLNPPNFPNNIGDNDSRLVRLRRVWDTWSTDYTAAPGVDLNGRGSPIQPAPLDRPIYPSYPPPYPQPLRGLQIQIRVVDPKNEKVKVLTIRQDFSDKL